MSLFRKFNPIYTKLKTKLSEDFELISDFLLGSPQSQNNYQNEQSKVSDRLLTKKTQSEQKSKYISSQLNQQAQAPNSVEVNKNKEKILSQKRSSLIKELKKIDSQLQNCHQEKLSLSAINDKKAKKTSDDDIEAFERAQNFIKKMNRNREEFMLRRKKSATRLNNAVNQSIRDYNAQQQEEQRRKQEKRREIQERIDKRKSVVLSRNEQNKKSNRAIRSLMNYPMVSSSRESLPNNLADHPFLNPQIERMVGIPQKKSKQQRQSDWKAQKHQKRPEFNPFLKRLFEEEELQKKKEQLSKLSKRRVVEKQRQYSDKIRGKVQHQADRSQLFVT